MGEDEGEAREGCRHRICLPPGFDGDAAMGKDGERGRGCETKSGWVTSFFVLVGASLPVTEHSQRRPEQRCVRSIACHRVKPRNKDTPQGTTHGRDPLAFPTPPKHFSTNR